LGFTNQLLYYIIKNCTDYFCELALKINLIKKGAGVMKDKGIFVIICVSMILGMIVLPVVGNTFDSEQLKQLKAERVCRNCDLSGADLSGTDLSGADLSGASFLKANLGGANLSGANLKGADLSGAIWHNASICKEGSIGECNTN